MTRRWMTGVILLVKTVFKIILLILLMFEAKPFTDIPWNVAHQMSPMLVFTWVTEKAGIKDSWNIWKCHLMHRKLKTIFKKIKYKYIMPESCDLLRSVSTISRTAGDLENRNLLQIDGFVPIGPDCLINQLEEYTSIFTQFSI